MDIFLGKTKKRRSTKGTKSKTHKGRLNYTTKTYEVFSTSTNLRVGDGLSPIKWYEYVNP